MSRTPAKRLSFLQIPQHVQWTQGELGSSAVIFLHFESLYGSLMKLHIDINHDFVTVSDHYTSIGYVDAWLAHQCPALVGLFHKQPCYDVLGFLVVSLVPDGCAERQQRAPSWIRGLLPSTSQYDIIEDGPTYVNVNYGDTHGNTTGLSCGLLRFLMMKFHVLEGDWNL